MSILYSTDDDPSPRPGSRDAHVVTAFGDVTVSQRRYEDESFKIYLSFGCSKYVDSLHTISSFHPCCGLGRKKRPAPTEFSAYRDW